MTSRNEGSALSADSCTDYTVIEKADNKLHVLIMMTRDGENWNLFVVFRYSIDNALFSFYSFQLVIAIPKWFKPAQSKWQSSRRTIASCTTSSSSAPRISSRECPATRFQSATSWTAEVKRTIWLYDWHALTRSRRTSSHSTSEYKVPKSCFVVKVILSRRRLRSSANLFSVKTYDWGTEKSTIYGELTRRDYRAQSPRTISNFKRNLYSSSTSRLFMSFHFAFGERDKTRQLNQLLMSERN